MIGIDTNVLLRFALEDHASQSRAAIAFFGADDRISDPAIINTVSLLEFTWTLARREGLSKPRILEILDAFADSGRVAYSDEPLIRACIEQWRSGEADLPDYLIAALNLRAGAATTVTFDKEAAQEPGFTLLPS